MKTQCWRWPPHWPTSPSSTWLCTNCTNGFAHIRAGNCPKMGRRIRQCFGNTPHWTELSLERYKNYEFIHSFHMQVERQFLESARANQQLVDAELQNALLVAEHYCIPSKHLFQGVFSTIWAMITSGHWIACVRLCRYDPRLF